MQWNKAKTILILFFLAVNIFLAAFLIVSVKTSDALTPEIISATVSTLENNNIYINTDIIKSGPKTMLMTELENVMQNNDDFAKRLLGEDASEIDENTYTNGSKTLIVNADSFTFTDTMPNASINITDGNVKAKAVDELAKIGIKATQNNVYEVINAGNVYKLKLMDALKDYPVYSSVIELHISSNGIQYLSGCWFNHNTDFNANKAKTKNIAGVLIDFISDGERNKDGQTVIKDLSAGYYIEDTNSIFHRSATAVPVWKITCEDAVYYVDARAN